MTHLKGDLDGRTTKKKIEVLASAGLPAPLVDVEIAETSGHLKKTDNLSQGQIVIRAPWLAREYHRDPKKSMELWKHGWLHTGDLGFIDKDGYIHVTDRVRNISKSGGEWVSHLKIENLVRKYPGVEEAAVVAIPDEVWGERPAVFVVIDNAHEVTVDSVQIEKFMHSFVRTGDLPKYALPDRYLIVDEIPKTEVQKIDVREIMERYGDLLFSAG
jgi:fatty-acyl-CoA synthase